MRRYQLPNSLIHSFPEDGHKWPWTDSSGCLLGWSVLKCHPNLNQNSLSSSKLESKNDEPRLLQPRIGFSVDVCLHWKVCLRTFWNGTNENVAYDAAVSGQSLWWASIWDLLAKCSTSQSFYRSLMRGVSFFFSDRIPLIGQCRLPALINDKRREPTSIQISYRQKFWKVTYTEIKRILTWNNDM